MKQAVLACAVVAGLAGFGAAGGDGFPSAVLSAAGDPHSYFNALVSSAAHYRSYSLRDQQQLEQYKNCGRCPAWVTYGPASDLYRAPQDAAKVVVPSFVGSSSLANAIGSGDTVVILTSANTAYVRGASLRVGTEVMTIQAKDGLVFTVTRGSLGTSPRAHAAGTKVEIGTNSLPNQVWLPMGTEDNHTYLTTWDAWYGRELVKELSGQTTWKTYQFRRQTAKTAAIWFEVRTRFDLAPSRDTVGMVDARGYSQFGPTVSKDQPLSPQAGTFVVKPEVWTRYWVQIEQRAGTWDLMTMWVSDEHTDPVKIINRLELETVNAEGGATVHSFQLEFNTSNDRQTMLRDDLVTYVRNVVMLRDAGDPAHLLLRPIAGAAPSPRPGAPRNVRILQ